MTMNNLRWLLDCGHIGMKLIVAALQASVGRFEISNILAKTRVANGDDGKVKSTGTLSKTKLRAAKIKRGLNAYYAAFIS
jgi:hypothetical protein